MSLYNPRHFVHEDPQAIRRVLEEYMFATLITGTQEDVHVSHIPVLFESEPAPHGSVIGHLARSNPQAGALAQGRTFLVFQGPFGYVSPNWYAAPAAAVPTWNYVAVHVHGRIVLLDELAGKRAIVDTLSARHEAAFAQPWTSAKMDPALLDKMLGAIVGFRMEVERIDAKFKLSQNRSGADRAGVISGLEQRDAPGPAALAEWMRRFAGP